MIQKYAIGDKVRVVSPDPKYSYDLHYVGFSGKIIEYNPTLYDRLPYMVQGELDGKKRSLLFCEQELDRVIEE